MVYVDNDPVVLAHARALLVSEERGHASCIDADLRDAGRILAESDVRAGGTPPADRREGSSDDW